MRYRRTPKQKPPIGALRTCTAFLVLPKCINNEVRWLEYATWEERRVELARYVEPGIVIPYTTWRAVGWLD